MPEPSAIGTQPRFGPFTLDPRSGELHKGATRLKVPDQSIEILKALLERPGDLVTRDELRQRLWPKDTFVDFEHGLNAAVRRLRDALGDSADSPQFIETLPRRGYRFIGVLEQSTPRTSDEAMLSPAAVSESTTDAPRRPRWRPGITLTFAAAASVIAILNLWWQRTARREPVPPVNTLTRLTFDPGLQMNPTVSPDGGFIAYASNGTGNFDIRIQSTTPGGEPKPVTNDAAHEWQPTWSPRGTHIVFRSERDGGGLFMIPTTGGHEKKISDFGYEPRWSPDGTRLLFSELALTGAGRGEMYTLALDGSAPKSIDLSALTGPEKGSPSLGWHPNSQQVTFFNIRVAPGQRTVQFATIDLRTGEATRSNIDPRVQDAFEQHRLLNARGGQPLVWAPDARAIYFIGESRVVENIWKVDVDPLTLAIVGGPHRLTAPSEHHEGLSLSGDGSRLVFGSATRNARIALYRLNAAGGEIAGEPEFVTGEEVHARAPDLTQDGSRLLFALVRPASGARASELRERRLGQPAPEGLLLVNDGAAGQGRFHPRWSPDARYIVYEYARRATGAPGAGAGRVSSLMLLDTRTAREEQLTTPRPIGTPQIFEAPYGWSRDGRFVIVSTDRRQPGVMSIALVPVDAKPAAEKAAQIVTI